MRWYPLARKEFSDLSRSKGLRLFGLVLIISSYFSIGGPAYVADALGPNQIIAAFQTPVTLFAGFAAILVSYRSVIGECESGSIKFVSGMPQRRYEILTGKIVGRTAALCVPLLVTFVFVSLLGVIQHGIFSLSQFVLFSLLSILYVFTIICVGTAISAVANTSLQAATASFGYYILFILGWIDLLSYQVFSAITGTPVNPLEPPASELLFSIHRATPIGAYNVLTNSVLDVGNSASWVTGVIADQLPNITSNALVVGLVFDGSQSAILATPLALGILALWISVPLLVSGYVFQRADLA
ncbi:ABC transporter permease [Haloferax mucosum]|nr:ABC transporter permease subunit [Haloferax mucosum]